MVARALLTAAAAALLATGGVASGARSTPNPIRAENSQAGTTAWQVRGTADVELYAGQISALPGDAVELHVSTPFRYRLVVFRLGWYGGAGARQVACIPGCDAVEQGTQQPPPDTTQEPIRAGWPVTDVLRSGDDWVSGYYLVEAVLTSGPDAGQAGTTFVILRRPAGEPPARILVLVPVNTWEAYNQWGGKSLYDFGTSRARAVSFDRPFGALAQSPMWWEVQLVRFLEREGYDVSYQTDLDTDREGASLLRHRLVIDAGHDEYWTGAMRDAFDRALAEGTNLAFTGSNDGYWQVRYEDGGRTIFSYKSMSDPNPVVSQKTAMFREVGRPECMLMAIQHSWFGVLDHPLDYTVTAAGAADPWLAGTGLYAGDTIAGVVGREHDKINPYPAACFKPGLVDLFHYDGGGVDQDGDAVRYTAPSGARVFASGAQEFTWALDGWRADGDLFPEVPTGSDRSAPVDPRVQQFMRNVLADLQKPAPPTGVTTRTAGGRIVVTVRRQADPRYRGFVSGTKTATGRFAPLCRGVLTCSGPLPPGRGEVVVGVVEIDRWGASSPTADYVVVQR